MLEKARQERQQPGLLQLATNSNTNAKLNLTIADQPLLTNHKTEIDLVEVNSDNYGTNEKLILHHQELLTSTTYSTKSKNNNGKSK